MKDNAQFYPQPYRENKILWKDHYTNGGTGVQVNSSPATIESVQLFNNPAIWIKGAELHTTLSDLSDFWQFHRDRIGERHHPAA